MSEIEDDLALALSSLPQNRWRALRNARIEPIADGLSGASVFRIVGDCGTSRYLKVARNSLVISLREEIKRTRWLAAHGMRVPVIDEIDDCGHHIVLLMQGVPGLPADADALPMPATIDALARGMAALHALSERDCPFDETLSVRLSRAAKAVAEGEIDVEDFEPRNRGASAATLLASLKNKQPTEDLAIVHGDATLSNLMIGPDGVIGFIDCGNVGRGDRYLDLAVLRAGIEDHYGKKATVQFTRTYGLTEWDSAKARFYMDLYEFF